MLVQSHLSTCAQQAVLRNKLQQKQTSELLPGLLASLLVQKSSISEKCVLSLGENQASFGKLYMHIGTYML